MNELQDEIQELFKTLEQNQALEHLVLIGSWATLAYQEYFKGADYHPVIRTTDIDFLVPKKPAPEIKIDIGKIMMEQGFLEELKRDGWAIYHKPEFHVEFLCSRVGPRSGDVLWVPQLGINVRPLRHMWLLTQNIVKISYRGIPLNLPHPAAYGLHKLIISARRTKEEKRIKDREQAGAVLAALSADDQKLFKEFFQQLSKKEKKAVTQELERNPFLQDLLKMI